MFSFIASKNDFRTIKSRKVIKKPIATRFKTFLDKISDNNIRGLQSRFSDLRTLFQQFQEIQLKLDVKSREKDEATSDEFENKYYKLVPQSE